MKYTVKTMSKLLSSLESLLGGALGLVLSFIAPVQHFIYLAAGLVILDTITGIRAAKRRGEKPNSKKASRIVDKILVYFGSIFACHGVEIVFGLTTGLTYFAAGAIAFTELMSVLENTRVVSGANVAGVVGGLLGKFKEVPEQEPEIKEKDGK